MDTDKKRGARKRDILVEIDEFGREIGADLLVATLLGFVPHISAKTIHAALVEQLDERLNIASVSPRARKAAMSIIDRLLEEDPPPDGE